MEADKKILPIHTDSETHINFYLSLILANDKMKPWFYERYINLVMYDHIIDYVDNINYSGIIGHIRSYSWNETKQRDLHIIIKEVIQGGGFLNIWVDEFDLPCSVWHHFNHFVHPLLVYGYDDKAELYSAWFFDIERGYRAVQILQRDFIKAVEAVEEFYKYGGTEASIHQTVGIFSIYGSFPILPFNLQVFLSQLKDYLYGKNNCLLQWYTLGRPELAASKNAVYGINVYLKLLEKLQNDIEDIHITYKSLHDFAMHKTQLLLRLEYIENFYTLGEPYRRCVSQIRKVGELMEKIRLLNIKYQINANDSAASFCMDDKFLAKLRMTLTEAYHMEMETLPEICAFLESLTYPKNYFDHYKIMTLAMNDGIFSDHFIEFNQNKCGKYLYRIDVVREGVYNNKRIPEKILLNHETAYYLEDDAPGHSPVRSVDFSPCCINNIKLYTDVDKADYKLILFLLPGQENRNGCTLYSGRDRGWYGFHQIENVIYEKDYMQFDVTGVDPSMMYDDIGIHADQVKYIRIRMATNDPSHLSQLFFTTAESPNISPHKSVYFPICPDGEMKTYTIDMSGNPDWKGMVRTIRFDPVAYLEGETRETARATCRLESIVFTKEPPPYDL